MGFFLRSLKEKRSAQIPADARSDVARTKRRGDPVVFLNALAGMIKVDLHNLARDADLFNRGIWQIKMQSGMFDVDKDVTKSKKKKSCYVYLSVPDVAGFLIETIDDEPHQLRLVRATQVAPLMSDFSGAAVRPNILVAQGQAVEIYDVIEDETVRGQTNIKTMAVERMSEMLITLAFDAFEAAQVTPDD